jgi:hypothetical protein
MTQNVTVFNPFSSYFLTQNHMNKIVSSTCVETFVHFKKFALLYSRVGAGAGAA